MNLAMRYAFWLAVMGLPLWCLLVARYVFKVL